MSLRKLLLVLFLLLIAIRLVQVLQLSRSPKRGTLDVPLAASGLSQAFHVSGRFGDITVGDFQGDGSLTILALGGEDLLITEWTEASELIIRQPMTLCDLDGTLLRTLAVRGDRSELVLAQLDDDPELEFVATGAADGVGAFDNDGRHIWTYKDYEILAEVKASADTDGDGIDEIVITDCDGVQLLGADGSRLWRNTQLHFCWDATVGDVGGDGDVDIVVADEPWTKKLVAFPFNSPREMVGGGVTLLDADGRIAVTHKAPSGAYVVAVGELVDAEAGPEIAVAGSAPLRGGIEVTVLSGTGKVLWLAPVSDSEDGYVHDCAIGASFLALAMEGGSVLVYDGSGQLIARQSVPDQYPKVAIVQRSPGDVLLIVTTMDEGLFGYTVPDETRSAASASGE